MTTPYYEDDSVVLFHGDCLEVTEWLAADVLVTDPPYGIGWTSNGISQTGYHERKARIFNGKQRPKQSIRSDEDTSARDAVLSMWLPKPAIAFGSLFIAPPEKVRHIAIYQKGLDSGSMAALAGLRRDCEAIYLLGRHEAWVRGDARRTSVFATGARAIGSSHGVAARAGGHPHTKPADVMETLLIEVAPPGTVADPFAGSGSTLVAAKALGRKAIGVELEERYCEIAARRLAQDVLPLEAS